MASEALLSSNVRTRSYGTRLEMCSWGKIGVMWQRTTILDQVDGPGEVVEQVTDNSIRSHDPREHLNMYWYTTMEPCLLLHHTLRYTLAEDLREVEVYSFYVKPGESFTITETAVLRSDTFQVFSNLALVRMFQQIRTSPPAKPTVPPLPQCSAVDPPRRRRRTQCSFAPPP